MKKDTLKGRMVSVFAIVIIFLTSAITGSLYFITKYYLYFFLAVTSLFFGATNLLFVLLQYIDVLSKSPKTMTKKKKKERTSKRKKAKRKKQDDSSEEEASEEETPEAEIAEIETPKKKKPINWYSVCKGWSYILYVSVFYCFSTAVWNYAKNLSITKGADAGHGIFALILFVILIIFDRICKYADNETPFIEALNENSRIFYKLLCFESLLGVAYVVYCAISDFNIQKYVVYVYVTAFYYFLAFITISLMVIAIRKEFSIAPYLNVPIPMWKTKGAKERQGFIEYLETNTGISMRSLWSVKYIRQIAPMVLFLSGILLWLSTCIVQVDSYQQAAVYRIGVLQDKMLGPGIHLGFPYPFDKVELYDTESINKVTIGYRSEESTDNIWISDHSQEEHKLLLGGGDELVSINLRLEYKIQDLKKYLETTASPEAHMQAIAYEMVTDRTMATDLNAMLSADREKFTTDFQKEISKKLEQQQIGLEVVSVVLESIHPPVEIAKVYQELIGAEISAEKFVLYAQGNAAAAIATAEKDAYAEKGIAEVQYAQKVAQARADIAEFLASVEANQQHRDAYKYQKRIAAVKEAYSNSKLVILGNGVDASMIYFGNSTEKEEAK